MTAVSLLPLAPQDALAFFDAKELAALAQRFDFRDLWLGGHTTAFAVAKAMRDDLLEIILAAVRKGLAEGLTLQTFKDRLAPEIKARGWWGEGSETDPLTGEVKTVRLGSDARFQVIFDANLRASYGAGQWARIQRSKDAFPYLRYRQIQRPSKRDEHARYHGLVLPVDHPAWAKIFPPNGWFCACSVEPLTAAQAKARGHKAAEDFELDYAPWENKRTGETELVPLGVDPAWALRPGA